MVSLARLRPIRGRWTRIKYVIGLTGLSEVFHHSWYQSKKFEMADRRDWGGGGDDPEESSQRMIERIWESLTVIRRRMDQQVPVPPVAVPPGDGETVPTVQVPPPPGVEVPFAAPVPPPPPVLIAEELVMQVEKFLRLQPPTYLGGPNPDTAEHWVHEIERSMGMEEVCSSSSSLSSFSSHRQVVAEEHRSSVEEAGLWLSLEPRRRHRT
ncbi:hypothetical protein Taro_002668 [Colocasia esculenta]|uniref:Uncharacterized protein n=1 Tax=Colocasia esculenta TaxID=4460 RepID=A0A843TJD8_COLES|nr:hypothetical protein [Colocasia esculenta]